MIVMETEMELDNSQGMTDYQKLQMTQLSYIDFAEMEKLKGMKLSDAERYLANPDTWSMGAQFSENGEDWKTKVANTLMEHVLKEDYGTDRDLYHQCVDAGFGDLTIKDIVSDKETGFQAIALEDQEGNVYFSFRGSDGDFSRGMQHDWMDANLKEFFLGDDGIQQQQAVEFFDRNKSETGQNAVFGHSLGGNLTSHVFAQRESEISQAFCYNANPISQRYLDTPAKQQAFQSERFTFAITEKDPVSGFKGHESYENRTVYIQNKQEDANPLYSHLAASASFNQDGSFALSSQTEHLEQRDSSKVIAAVLSMTHGLDEIMQNHGELAECLARVFQGQWPDNLKETIQEISPEAAAWIGQVYDQFFDVQGLDVVTPTELFQQYNDMSMQNQQMQQPELLLDGFGQTMQAQDTMYIQPELLMSMSGSMMGMDPAMQGMEGMSMFQTISQTVGQMEGMGQYSSDGLMSWGDNADMDPDMDIDEEMDQEDSMGFKFNGIKL